MMSSAFRKGLLNQISVYLAWLQAFIATLGSLFFSEVMGYIPCSLCWYQRIFMYPLVFILTTAILLRDRHIRHYSLPLSVLGLVLAIYHNLLYFGVISEGLIPCTAGISCTVKWFEWFGFISIPQLSLAAFAVITICIVIYQQGDTDDSDQETV